MHSLKKPREVCHLHAVQAALEQRAKRQHPATLFAHGDDDLVHAKLLDGLLQRSAARDDAAARNKRFLLLLERVKTNQPQTRRRGGRQRSFDQFRFDTRPEHQDPVRKHSGEQRQHERVSNEQQPAESAEEGDSDILLKQTAAGESVGDNVRERDADGWSKE